MPKSTRQTVGKDVTFFRHMKGSAAKELHDLHEITCKSYLRISLGSLSEKVAPFQIKRGAILLKWQTVMNHFSAFLSETSKNCQCWIIQNTNVWVLSQDLDIKTLMTRNQKSILTS